VRLMNRKEVLKSLMEEYENTLDNADSESMSDLNEIKRELEKVSNDIVGIDEVLNQEKLEFMEVERRWFKFQGKLEEGENMLTRASSKSY